MSFDIGSAAKGYIEARYPRASRREREKYIRDWIDKLPAARGVVKDLIDRVGEIRGKEILDSGCGNGGLSIALAQEGALPTGVEVESKLCEIAKEQAAFYRAACRLVLVDENAPLPFASESFDGAVSVSVLEHVSKPEEYLAELLRVTRRQGRLYLAFPNKLWPKETHTGLWFLTYLPAPLQRACIRLFGKNPLEDNNLHFYSYRALLEMLRKIKNDGARWEVVKEMGQTANPFKKLFKAFFGCLGISHRELLPHVSVILTKTKR